MTDKQREGNRLRQLRYREKHREEVRARQRDDAARRRREEGGLIRFRKRKGYVVFKALKRFAMLGVISEPAD